MSHDLEVIGAASAGGLVSGEHHQVDSPGEPCRNCGAIVTGRYCARCGQLASNFHRPFFSLITSSLADTFALDSRLWRTVPMLLFRPGRVTRNYLDGKRSRYVPPFRLFLLASVLFFLAVFGLGDQQGWYKDMGLNLNLSPATGGAVVVPEQKDAAIAELRSQLDDPDLSDARRTVIEATIERLESGEVPSAKLVKDGHVDRDAVSRLIDEQTGISPAEAETIEAAANRIADVFENQDKFAARFREWAPRFSLMFMPLLALMLAVLYVWHRKTYVYDHVIVALHVQTFIYGLATLLLLSVAFLGLPVGWAVGIGSLWVVWYLYKQLRVTYGTGRLMAALRTSILLFLGTSVLFLLAIGLVVLSFLLT